MSSLYFPEESARFQSLLNSLRAKRVAVLGHMRPDGDCIGSQVALCRILHTTVGADAICVNHHTVPRNLQAFVGDTPFLHENDFVPDGHVAVCTDCSDLTRIGKALVARFSSFEGNIDHHLSNSLFARENIVLPSAAAACHMIAAFAFDLGLPLDAVTAQALYVGIVTDTGQFKYPSTTPEVLEISARLVRLGASPQAATASLYEHDSFGRLALLQRFLASLKLYAAGKICIGEIPLGTFEATGTTREDTEGLVDYARCIDGVDVAALLEEMPDGVKGSLRAKDARYRVDQLGKKLNGGGHALAAGFNLEGASLDKDRQRIVDIITTHLSHTDAAE
ncbi:MAG: DHH family phosphoesterase [Puniceicoccales bacterium]|jgi:phosphoesterase RecJ-like protein|nr:DHH family phosphoesterase [Puniceicoccales bacterium]